MKHSLLFLSLLALVLTACTSQEPSLAAQSAEPIQIGFVAPLTGDLAAWGKSVQGGVELAVQEINAQGGINGRPLVVTYEDDQCDAKASVTAVNKLISVSNVVGIIGTMCSSTTLAVAPVVEQNKVVLLSVGSSNPAVTEAGDYVFRMWPSDSYQGTVLAKYVTEQGYKNIALLVVNTEYGLGVAKVLREELPKFNGIIVSEQVFASGETDFKTPIEKIKAAKPDAIVVVMYAEAPLIHKQLREAKVSLPVFGTETYDVPVLIEAADGAMEGAMFSLPAFSTGGAAAQVFLEGYVKAFGAPPEVPQVAAYAYDGMVLFAEGLKQDPTAEGIKNYLYTVQNRELSGGTVTFDANGDVVRPFSFKRIEQGKTVVIEENYGLQ